MHSAFRIPQSAMGRRGVTLIEMLIAIAVSLIVLFAVIRFFDRINYGMNRSRSEIEQAGELRNVTQRLREDLDGMTASTLPWSVPDAGNGYFEYIEGPRIDKTDIAVAGKTMWGDYDDVLMFTARSNGRPFIGRFNGAPIESEYAEIIWWTRNLGDLNGNGAIDPAEIVLHRRALLIRPDLTPPGGDVASCLLNNDISVRVGTSGLVANSLADLTLRQNRTFHDVATFPHVLTATELSAGTWIQPTDRVLDRVVGFDVRVYDPMAPIRSSANASVLAPGDPGWLAATTLIGRGAFVDLNYAGNTTTSFYSGLPNAKSQLTAPTYSTWPLAYEQDGVDQNGNSPLIDEGRDGFDNGGAVGAIDDPGEYETAPPYPHAITGQKTPGLRGVQVRIRVYEPASRAVRQASVASNFVPE